MKWSKYNILFASEKGLYLLYNSYTNNFMEISKDEFLILDKCRQGDFSLLDEDYVKFLSDEKILVDDDNHIYNLIKLQRTLARYDTSFLALTIAPTLNCNFKCVYCYEENVQCQASMTEKTMSNVFDFVKSFRNISGLRVTWYGGEPLLKFNVIEKLTDKFLNLFNHYEASMITNGYCLNESVVLKLKNLHISKLQITIDGLREVHNKRRLHKVKNDSFDKIISNLDYLFSQYKDVYVAFRINIDKNNQFEYERIYNFLNDKYGKYNIAIYPGYVTDEYSKVKKSSCMNCHEKVSFLASCFRKDNRQVSIYPKSEFGECGARHINSFVIGPEGELYKCWNDIGVKDKSFGFVDKYKGVRSKQSKIFNGSRSFV